MVSQGQYHPLTRFSDGVVRRVLSNGSTILIKVNRAAPVVAVASYVKAGYFNEPDDRVGLAHLIEHLYFKGSQKYPGPEDIGMAVEAVGGNLNAGTIYDYTYYYFTLPAASFEKGVEIQADALANPLFDPDELRREAEVIIEESKRKYDNPSAFASEKLYELVFDRHRMRRWRIGSDHVLRTITRDDVVEFFASLYRPANIVVVVVGDVDPDRGLDIIEREFGKIPPGAVHKETSPPEPPQATFKYQELRGDIHQAYMEIGFHTPGVLAPDTEALDLLAAIVGRGRSSRLHQRVKEERQLVDTIGADSYAYADVGLFHITATLDPTNRFPAAEAAFEELERVKIDTVSDEELERALAMMESGYVFQQQSVSGQAFMLAYYEAYGGYTLVDEQLQKLYAVTKEDIRRVANTYVRLPNCSVLEYVPAGVPGTDRTAVSVEQALAERMQYVRQAELSPPPSIRRAFSWGDIGGPGRPETDIRMLSLSNGMTVLVKELHAVPVVSIGAFCRGGRNKETRANAGLTNLALRTSRKGTASRSAEEIAREIELLGTTIEFVVDADYFGYSMTILQRHVGQGFDIFQDIIRHPTFPDSEVSKERESLLAAILRDKDNAFTRPFQLFNEAFYGDHPYALPSNGLDESVRALTSRELRDWHTQSLDPSRMVVVVVGDVDTDRVQEVISQSLGVMSGQSGLTDRVPPVVPPLSIRTAVETRRRKQTAMALGFPGTSVNDSDRYALEVLANIASSFGGRLFMELRGRQSLAYTVAAYDIPRRAGGAFAAYIASDVAKEERAREGLLQEFARFKVEPPTEEEVRRAHAYMTGSYTIRLQTAAAQAAEYARNALLGLSLDEFRTYPDRIRQVTRDDLHRAASTYFDLERYAIGILRGMKE